MVDPCLVRVNVLAAQRRAVAVLVREDVRQRVVGPGQPEEVAAALRRVVGELVEELVQHLEALVEPRQRRLEVGRRRPKRRRRGRGLLRERADLVAQHRRRGLGERLERAQRRRQTGGRRLELVERRAECSK